MIFSNLGDIAREAKRKAQVSPYFIFETSCAALLPRVAKIITKHIKDQILKQKGVGLWKKLSELTIYNKVRNKDKILMEFKDLGKSITWERVRFDTAAIGIPHGSFNRFGKSLVLIGAVHEFGALIRVTKRMEGYFKIMAKAGLFHPGFLRIKEGSVLRIPKRSFIDQGFHESLDDVNKVLTQALPHALRLWVGM
jgi:hypothetical protein